MPFVTSTTGSLGAGRRNVPEETTPAEIRSYYVSNSGTDGVSISGNVSAPFKTLNYAISRITDQNTIYFADGSYKFDEQEISTTGLTLQSYNNENVTFDGTREIYDLADTSVNNGNWQWVASTGADSQPYFRIFNPWIQSKTHDPNCIYIKKWIPELNDLPNNEIHEYFKYYKNYIKNKDFKYIAPMVDYNIQREKALNMYKKINE